MDKKGFEAFLRSPAGSKGRRLSDTAVRAYVYSVKRFEKWLNNSRGRKQKLDNANKEDIYGWLAHLQKKNTPPRTISLIFSGLSKYYLYSHSPKIVKAIKEIRCRPESYYILYWIFIEIWNGCKDCGAKTFKFKVVF